MKRPYLAFALLTSIAGLAFSATSARALDETTPPLRQAALVQSLDTVIELSAQARRAGGGGARVGRVGGNVGRVGGNVGRVGRVGNVGRVGRVGNVGRVGRIGRVEGRIGRIGRIEGRIGYRYGRVGRVGYVPVPIPYGPGPMGPGPGARVVGPTCATCPVQACLVAVYAEPNLAGQGFETAENQPRLDQNQWQGQISSIIVKGGTWEFYPDLEFRGGPPVLRLVPGSYPVLEPQWTKRIGSFMCVR
jgi:Beta/Gamma crystallin